MYALLLLCSAMLSDAAYTKHKKRVQQQKKFNLLAIFQLSNTTQTEMLPSPFHDMTCLVSVDVCGDGRQLLNGGKFSCLEVNKQKQFSLLHQNCCTCFEFKEPTTAALLCLHVTL